MQTNLKHKERLLDFRQQELENFAASLGHLLQKSSIDGKVEVLPSQIFLWRRQAGALNRSKSHLDKIDRLVDIARDVLSESVLLSIRDCGAMLMDTKEFTDLAFKLINDKANQET